MSRPLVDYTDPSEVVASVSHDLTRALQPGRAMPADCRRRNLRQLAEAVLSESEWDVPKVLLPAYRPVLRYYATCAEPEPPFARLLIAVRAYRDALGGSDRESASNGIVAALDRLVPDEVTG